jgi:hypothetical protein
MYIVLIALKKQQGYKSQDFCRALKEVLVPVSMTSMVNASMFAVMNISDIPAIYRTAQVALISVIFLYLTIIFCFPAWCWLDMRRQAQNRLDVVVCKKGQDREANEHNGDLWASFIYDDIYKPLVLGSRKIRYLTHAFIWLVAAAMFAVGIYGLTKREIGLGLEVGSLVRCFFFFFCFFSHAHSFIGWVYRISFRKIIKLIVGQQFELKNWHRGILA